MHDVITNVNTTAMVIGYPVLVIILFLMAWFGSRVFRDLLKIFSEMRYDRWRRKHEERDWDNIEASWMLELDEDNREPIRYFTHDTIELPDISEQLYNYQQEEFHERS